MKMTLIKTLKEERSAEEKLLAIFDMLLEKIGTGNSDINAVVCNRDNVKKLIDELNK